MMKKDKKQQKKGVNKSNFHRDTASSTSFVDVIDTNETIFNNRDIHHSKLPRTNGGTYTIDTDRYTD